jgi:hypothetical protein
MSKFNEVARLAMSEKLTEALKREGLNKQETARILKVLPMYVSQMTKTSTLSMVPDKVWEIVQTWTNSGMTLRRYCHHNAGINVEPVKDPEPLKIKVTTVGDLIKSGEMKGPEPIMEVEFEKEDPPTKAEFYQGVYNTRIIHWRYGMRYARIGLKSTMIFTENWRNNEIRFDHH